MVEPTARPAAVSDLGPTLDTSAGNYYSFRSVWRVTGTVAEVREIFDAPTELSRWWPSVYLAVEELEPGDDNGKGRIISLRTTGWLPYTLRWRFQVMEIDDQECRFRAWGDFIGTGSYRLSRVGDETEIVWVWRVLADKPLLRRFSGLLKPVFAANHGWAMRQGLKALRLELRRQRAVIEETRVVIPDPPPPTNALPGILTVAGIALVGALWLGHRRARRRW